MSLIAKNRIKSTWTPLSNEETNNKIFEERRVLIGKWYDKWSDDQRKKVLEDLLHKSKTRQLEFVRDHIRDNAPHARRDFTRHLPRVLSLYLFSFLDPRSLSRCAQVCWHWRYITEVDQLWMPKCLKLGWSIPYMPSPYEVGIWKRNYVENIKTLQLLKPKGRSNISFEKLKLTHYHSSSVDKSKQKSIKPWRGSDPVPKDTWRYNYLENDDAVDSVNKLRKKKTYGPEANEISRNARSKVKTGQNIHNQQLRRSQSAGKLQQEAAIDNHLDLTGFRPTSAFTPKSIGSGDKNTQGISRPAPVQSNSLGKTKSRPVSSRTPRDPPTTDLFPTQPWRVPNNADSDEDI